MREIWTDQDELEFQIGDMNGIAFKSSDEQKKENQKKTRKVRIKWKKIWKQQNENRSLPPNKK